LSGRALEFGGELRSDVAGFLDLAVIEASIDRGIKASFNPRSAVEQMAATLKEYGLSSTVGDKYAGVGPGHLRQVDVTYTLMLAARGSCS
jgi:hypothetical protein